MSTQRVGYLGPAGTFTHEALVASGVEGEPVPLPTVHDTVMAVHDGAVERSLVPIENSLEGSVNSTLDALALETEEVVIVGELIHPVRQCLVARAAVALEEVATVVSHPHASAQCRRFLRERLGPARVLAAASTAEAVRQVTSGDDRGAAAIGTRLAAELYGGEVLLSGIEDVPENQTRFVWLAREGGGGRGGPWKTSIVFSGAGAGSPGWLVRCLSEFAFRGVNLTRIESRPSRQGLGRYMFFVDLEGRAEDAAVAGSIDGLRAHADAVRVLGSFPGAA
jgi:prephenate dehydratase